MRSDRSPAPHTHRPLRSLKKRLTAAQKWRRYWTHVVSTHRTPEFFARLNAHRVVSQGMEGIPRGSY